MRLDYTLIISEDFSLRVLKCHRINDANYLTHERAGWFSRYSDWLQAGRSRDRIPVGGEIFQTGPGVHPAFCKMGTGSFLALKSGRGVTLTLHLRPVPWPRKSRAIPLLPLWTVRSVQTLSACTVQLYLYSHYGPYSLYRASVPVQ